MLDGTYTATYLGAPIYDLVQNRDYVILIEKQKYTYTVIADNKTIDYSSELSIKQHWNIKGE